MRSPFMGGNFPFPVKYGYSIVGSVEAGPANLEGQIVFVLHPHQTLFNVPLSAVVRLPENLPHSRAVLAANMETALNAVWDGAPGPADRIAIIGAGAVGALVAFLCGRNCRRGGHARRYQSRVVQKWRANWASTLPRLNGRRPIAISSSRPAPQRPDLRRRSKAVARKRL